MLAIGLRLLSVLFIATMMAGVKLAGERGVHVWEALFYRQLLALPLVLGWLWAGPGILSVRTSRIGAHAMRSLAGMTGMVLNFLSVMLLPLAEATTIGFTVPIFATILSALLLKEQTGIHRWSAVLAGFCGVLVMVHPAGEHVGTAGVAVAICAAVTVAIVSILLRQIGRTEATATTVFWFTVLSIPPLGAGMLIFGQNHDPLTWGLLLLIGLAGGAGQLCLTGALRWGPVSAVLPMDYSSLLWATLYGWALWDNWPTGSTWAGAVLIIGSGLYIAWREHVRAARR